MGSERRWRTWRRKWKGRWRRWSRGLNEQSTENRKWTDRTKTNRKTGKKEKCVREREIVMLCED